MSKQKTLLLQFAYFNFFVLLCLWPIVPEKIVVFVLICVVNYSILIAALFFWERHVFRKNLKAHRDALLDNWRQMGDRDSRGQQLKVEGESGVPVVRRHYYGFCSDIDKL